MAGKCNLYKVTYPELGKDIVSDPKSGQAGGQYLRIPTLWVTMRPPCHLIKPMPCLGKEHLKRERNVTGQNFPFPRFLITCKPTQGSYITLLSCQHPSFSSSRKWWKLRRYADMSSMWKTTPRFPPPWNIQRPMYMLLDTQTDRSVHSCT